MSLFHLNGVWLNMMVLYIYHGDNGMEMMIQEVYSTYMVDGMFLLWHVPRLDGYNMFCYGMVVICSTVDMVWLWYVPRLLRYGCGMFHGGMFHQGWLPREWLLRCPPWVPPAWGRHVAMP